MVRVELVDGEPVVTCADGTISLRQRESNEGAHNVKRPGLAPREAARALAWSPNQADLYRRGGQQVVADERRDR